MWKQWLLVIISLSWWVSCVQPTPVAEKGFKLPLLPPSLQEHIAKHVAHHKNVTTGKFIPQLGWVAVRNASDARANHWLGKDGFLARNPQWTFHFCGNEEKDDFMAVTFANTSLLWAYEILNPQIGTAKAELWRLAILYVHGGMYIDDDANIGTPLNDVVQPADKFIVGKEGYNWTDMCFRDEFALSNASFNVRFGLSKNNLEYFDNKFFFNWALFAMPGNPLLVRILQHVVDLIKFEYLGKSMVKLAPSDHRGKLLMCVSTFPITLAAREMVMEGQQEQIGLRVGGEQFREYHGDMKAWNNDYNPHRWVKQMQKYRMPYLREYAPPDISDYENRLIQPQKSREVYFVQKGQKHAFPSFQTLLKMNFTLEHVQMVSGKIAEMIPTGAPLPELK